MTLLSQSLSKRPKRLDLSLELADQIGFAAVACEEAASLAHEQAECADDVTPRLRQIASTSEFGDRVLEIPLGRHNEDFAVNHRRAIGVTFTTRSAQKGRP